MIRGNPLYPNEREHFLQNISIISLISNISQSSEKFRDVLSQKSEIGWIDQSRAWKGKSVQ
jgi:hypothetical protein